MMIHHSNCAARAAPCSCGLEDRFKTMITLLSIDVGRACGVLSNHGLEPRLVDEAMRNAHRVETRAEAVERMAKAVLAWRNTYLTAAPYLLRTPPTECGQRLLDAAEAWEAACRG